MKQDAAPLAHGYGLCTHTDFDCGERTCCEIYGNCNQGRTCPNRTGIVTPEQQAHMDAARLGGGNIVFAGEEPDFAHFDQMTYTLAHRLGVLFALLVLVATVGFVWVQLA